MDLELTMDLVLTMDLSIYHRASGFNAEGFKH